MQVVDTALSEEEIRRDHHYTYPAMEKTQGSFHLKVEEGEFR